MVYPVHPVNPVFNPLCHAYNVTRIRCGGFRQVEQDLQDKTGFAVDEPDGGIIGAPGGVEIAGFGVEFRFGFGWVGGAGLVFVRRDLFGAGSGCSG